MGRLTDNRKLVVFLIIFSLLLVPIVSSRSIHQISQRDIFLRGEFNEPNDWLIETQSGFSNLEAKNTHAIIADGKLSLTHQRSQNLKEMTFWSTNSNSGHESAEGTPDGSYSISSGADIDLSGFDFSSLNNYPLVSTTLIVSFRISDGLNDDRVEFSISSNVGVFMVHSYSSTFSEGEINHLSSPYMTYNLDSLNEWDWDSLSSSSIKLNYESIGGSDEAQLEVDGVALSVVYQMPESGFDFVKAETNLQLDNTYDYENMTLNLSAEIIGDLGNIDDNLSWLKLQIGTEIIYEQKLNSNMKTIELSLDLNDTLFAPSIEYMLFAIGIQIYWDSNGSSSDAVISIDDITLGGVTFTEWDENPHCTEIEDLSGNNSFLEDSGQYKIIPLRDTCTDDRTSNDDLMISVITSPENIIQATIDDGHLKIFQIQDSSGLTEVTVDVFDTSGNIWSDSFIVEVVEVNDSPVLLNFPDEVWIELGDELNINGTLFDAESLIGDLQFSVDRTIAKINSDNSITLSPIELGIVEVTLTVSDGNSVGTHKIRVNTFSESDLISNWIIIKSADAIIDNENDKYKSHWASNVWISTEIENLGTKDATFVSVRYYLNEELIGNMTLPLVSAKSSQVAELEWNFIGSPGDYTIKVIVDSYDTIEESNEMNNEFFLSFVLEVDNENKAINSESMLDGVFLNIGIIFGFLLLGLALYFGPKKVQKIQ